MREAKVLTEGQFTFRSASSLAKRAKFIHPAKTFFKKSKIYLDIPSVLWYYNKALRMQGRCLCADGAR